MAILDIISENKNLSWVIKKNPNTQREKNEPFKRELRKGLVFSWYLNENTFRSYFKDGKESSFYKDLNNKYLNQSEYNCPYVFSSIINENLSNAIKNKDEKDIECLNTIILHNIYIPNLNILKMFKKHFDEYSIEAQYIENKVFKLEVKSTKSLYDILNFVNVMCLIFSIEDKNLNLVIEEALAFKYAQKLMDINAPYYIIYLFNSRLISDYKVFEKIKTIYSKNNWDLFYGNTQKQRYEQIKKHIKAGKLLHDIGCGELYYSKYFKDKYENVIAWDSDEQIQERNQKYLAKKEIKNIKLESSIKIKNINSDKETDLLITEVLEHIHKEDAIELLKEIKNKEFRKLIITLPNKNFNYHYKLDSFRHIDHQWEPSYEESVDMIKEIFGNNLKEIKKIGDKINNDSVSTLFIIGD